MSLRFTCVVARVWTAFFIKSGQYPQWRNLDRMVCLRGRDMDECGWVSVGGKNAFLKVSKLHCGISCLFCCSLKLVQAWFFEKSVHRIYEPWKWEEVTRGPWNSIDLEPLFSEFIQDYSSGCRDWRQLPNVTLAFYITPFHLMPCFLGIQYAYIYFKIIFGLESKYLLGY